MHEAEPRGRPNLCLRCLRCDGSSTSSGGSSSGSACCCSCSRRTRSGAPRSQEAHTQSGLRTQLQTETNSEAVRHALAEESALDKLPTGPPVTAPTTAAPAEGEPIGDIRIPVIGINQVVVEGTNTPDLRKGPGHYIGTPLPGQAGNVAIAGHRTTYGHPFYNLDSVKVGDPIVLTTLQGIFVYDATKSFVVSPSDTSVVDNVFANLLTLTTCNPRFSASTRLVVQATLAHSQLFPNSGLPVHADSSTRTRRARAWPATPTSCSPARCSGDSSRPSSWHGHLLRRLAFPAPALADLRGGRRGHARAALVLLRGRQPRCSPPASDARARRGAAGRPLPGLRRGRRA